MLLLTGVEFEYGFTAGCVIMAKDLSCASASSSVKKKKKKKGMWVVLTPKSCFGDCVGMHKMLRGVHGKQYALNKRYS